MSDFCLITSGAYVNQELAIEFGPLPPAFLPVGTSRLYEAQVASLSGKGKIYLSVPDGFVPPLQDQRRLEALGVDIIGVPVDLTLGESIVYALNYIGSLPGLVHVLHGDTLIKDIPLGDRSIIAIRAEDDDYAWATVAVDDRGNVSSIEMRGVVETKPPPSVACGYFVFESGNSIVRAITRARGDFVEALNLYSSEHDVAAVPVEEWYDFGHLQTYFRSRRAVTTARSFNTLRISDRTVRKSSGDVVKMKAEAKWLSCVPPAVLPFAARLFESGPGFYEIEYQYSPTLAELFVFSKLGRLTWQRILGSCFQFMDACSQFEGPGDGGGVLEDLAVNKTLQRLEQYASDTGFDIHREMKVNGKAAPSLVATAEEAIRRIDLGRDRAETVMHGDFCFSNILYNSRSSRICVIDPRGYRTDGTLSIYGDVRYDLAKLNHSIVGCYDLIIAGRHSFIANGSYDLDLQFDRNDDREWLAHEFQSMAVGGVRADTSCVQALTILLFLSMLPLHKDRPDRQQAFIANALRLNESFKG